MTRRSEGSERNADRMDRGQAPRGRPPKDWPKDVPRKPVEADDVPDDGDDR